MSATTHVPGSPWVRTHRAVLTIALLAAALAATLALLLLQLTTGSTATTPASGPVSTKQVPAPPQQEIKPGCPVRGIGVPHC